MNIGTLLTQTSRLCRHELGSRLSEVNLTVAQYLILRDIYTIERQPNPEKNLTPACIANRLNSDRPTITEIVKRLIEHGFLVKQNNELDKRSFYLVLTEKSYQLMPKLEELHELTITKAISGFSQNETTQLTVLLNKIIQNLTIGEKCDE